MVVPVSCASRRVEDLLRRPSFELRGLSCRTPSPTHRRGSILVPDTRRFPPLSGALTTDVIVLGGGMVGVMAAYCLATSGRDVVLVERNHIGTGDSGFTTAFLTRVPDAAAADLVERYGRGFLRDLFAATADAQRFITNLIREQRIDCDLVACNSFNGSFETGSGGLADEWHALEGADPGIRFSSEADVPPAARPFVESIVIEDEARFHVRKFLVGLIDAAGPRLRVFEESDVQSVDPGDRVRVASSTGSIDGRVIIVACGGPPDLFGELSPLVSPKLTFAVAARFAAGAPVADHLFWDSDEPYQYFRRLDEHTIIVGGADRDQWRAPAAIRTSSCARSSSSGSGLRSTSRTDGRAACSRQATDCPLSPPILTIAIASSLQTGLSGNGMVMGALAGRQLAGFATGAADSRLVQLFGPDRTGITIAQAAPARAKGISLHDKSRTQPDSTAAGSGRCATERGCARIGPMRDGGDDAAGDRQRGRPRVRARQPMHACGRQDVRGRLDGTVLRCPLHGSRFEVTTGAVVAGPARLPLATHETRVVDGRIEVSV